MSTLAKRSRPDDVIHFDQMIDARGLACPFPFLNTKTAVDDLKPGEVLKILTTDRNSASFFESLTRQTGLELHSWATYNDELVFYLGKG